MAEAIDAIEYIYNCMKKTGTRWYRSASEGFADWLNLIAVNTPYATVNELAGVSENAQFENALISLLGYDGVLEVGPHKMYWLLIGFDTTGTQVIDRSGIRYVSNMAALLEEYKDFKED